MIHLTVTVLNTAEKLAVEAYGPDALLRWESSATQTGVFVEGGTIALEAAVSLYDVWDPAGETGVTWYRTRLSNAAGTTFSAYSAAVLPLPSLVSIAEVRALVRSRLSDPDLQVIIDREEAWLAARIGVLSGSRIDVLTPRTANAPVYLARRTVISAVTDAGTDVLATAYSHTPSSGELRRLALTTMHGQSLYEPWFPAWAGAVAVTHTPSDEAAVKRAIIELVRGSLGETGLDAETIGDYSYTRGTSSARLSRPALVRSILTTRGAYSLPIRSVMEPA